MLKRVFDMTEAEKQRFVDITGRTIMYIEERRNIWYIAERLNLEPWQVNHNIDEILWNIRKCFGVRRIIKSLFIK